jgi:hypothetical protein
VALGLLIGLLSATGCVSDAVTVAPRPPASYERMGGTEGEACGSVVLGAIPIEMGTRVERALAEAMQRKPGATQLINTQISWTWYWWLFGNTHCTSVEGEAIRELAAPVTTP